LGECKGSGEIECGLSAARRGQARLGVARRGGAWQGEAWILWRFPDAARRGAAWRGAAWPGLARQGEAGILG
jgi:hypothetical protein